MHPWLNWIEHRPPKAGITGSNPVGCAKFFYKPAGLSMKSFPILFLSLFTLCACNHVYLKPGTMVPNTEVYTTRGGYTLRPAAKQTMEERGYTIKIGKDSAAETLGADIGFLKPQQMQSM